MKPVPDQRALAATVVPVVITALHSPTGMKPTGRIRCARHGAALNLRA
jgi:hypothetical protein